LRQAALDLRRRFADGSESRAEQSGMTPTTIILYSRRGCHLCDDAKALLVGHGLHPKEVDIDSDPALVERYGLVVPVVEIDGCERFRGRIDAILLRRLLAQKT
jgi:glutaredoxin